MHETQPLSIVTTVLLAAAACGGEPSVTCGATRAALFHGSPDSGELALRPDQERAIGVLEDRVSREPLCTLTLIAPGYALSAAHCAATPGAMVRWPGVANVHEFRWEALHDNFDVGILAFAEDNADAEPLPLHDAIDDSWLDTKVTLAGLGVTETGSSGELRFVDEQITKLTETEIWVDGRGKSGACAGDSGGPLLVRDAEGAIRVAGILDRGSPSCTGLDVYTRADRLLNWVHDTVDADAANANCE